MEFYRYYRRVLFDKLAKTGTVWAKFADGIGFGLKNCRIASVENLFSAVRF